MPQPDTRSLQQIKRETEQTRAGLTDTVEQLKTSVADTASEIRQRISPESIKAEVSGYIKSRGEQLVNDVTAAARKNPMQAVAVGASLAYPLFRLARSIPAPVLMLGAGLFLAGSKTGQGATQKASNMASDLSEDLLQRAQEVRDQVGDSATAATNYASAQFDRASAAVSAVTGKVGLTADRAGGAVAADSTSQDRAATPGGTVTGRVTGITNESAGMAASAATAVRDAAASLGDSVAGKASDVKEQVVRMASSTGDTVKDFASGAVSAGRNTANTTVDAGRDAAKAARETASDLTDRAGKTIFQTIEQNPLVVAGVGLLIGGLIASALPRSDIEDDLVGSASNVVKRKADDAASQGINAARETAGQVYNEATRLAEAEGLSPKGIAEAAQNIGQRVRRVAEAAVTTAFEPDQENPQPRTRGATDHG
jgi:hypothetical protein